MRNGQNTPSPGPPCAARRFRNKQLITQPEGKTEGCRADRRLGIGEAGYSVTVNRKGVDEIGTFSVTTSTSPSALNCICAGPVADGTQRPRRSGYRRKRAVHGPTVKPVMEGVGAAHIAAGIQHVKQVMRVGQADRLFPVG